MRCGHRGTLPIRIGGDPRRPVCRQDPRTCGIIAARRRNIDVEARVGVIRPPVSRAGGAHANHVLVGRWIDGRVAFQILVAGGRHDDHIMCVGIVDGIHHCLGLVGTSQTEADHRGAMVNGPDDGAGHVTIPTRPGAVQNFQRHQAGVPVDAGDSKGVVGDSGGDAGAVRSVPMIVLGD